MKNSTNPLVNVIMPVYGVEAFIGDSVRSIIAQDYSNIELLLVDDETKDSSIDIAVAILRESGIKYSVIRQKNKGLPGARNTGLMHCNGKYVCFIDSDDLISSEHISSLVRLCEDEDLIVAYSGFEFTNVENRYGNEPYSDETCVETQDALFEHFLRRKPTIHCCSLMINREYLVNTGMLFNERLRYGEDVDFMWRLFSDIPRIGRVLDKSYKYLIRSNSIMTSVGLEKGKVLIGEFRQALSDLSGRYPSRQHLYDLVFYRTVLGWLNKVAEASSYAVFKEATDVIRPSEIWKNLRRFPDIRIRVFALILAGNRRLYYSAIRMLQ